MLKLHCVCRVNIQGIRGKQLLVVFRNYSCYQTDVAKW